MSATANSRSSGNDSRATQRALDAVAGDDITEVREDDDMLIGEVADALGIRTSALRTWDAAGLVRPRRTPRYGYRTYSPADVRDARVTAQLRLSGYGVDQVREVLQAWRVTGGAQAIRAAIATREDALATRSRSMLTAAAALRRSWRSSPVSASPERAEPVLLSPAEPRPAEPRAPRPAQPRAPRPAKPRCTPPG